jgi:hypothetical protein
VHPSLKTFWHAPQLQAICKELGNHSGLLPACTRCCRIFLSTQNSKTPLKITGFHVLFAEQITKSIS